MTSYQPDTISGLLRGISKRIGLLERRTGAGGGGGGTPGPPGPAGLDGESADWDFRMDPSVWTGAAGARLTLPTHVTPSGGEVTHPSVLFFPEKWNGYRYWMAYTPYPGGNDDHEDPNLAVSNDGINWVFAPGVTQPLDDADGTPEYNSDTDLAMGPDNTMYLFWRFYDSSLGSNQEKVYVRTSVDGVNWTAKQLVYEFNQATRRPLSPSFVFEDNRWTVWAVDIVPGTPVVTRMQTSGPSVTSGWGTPVNCTVSAMPSGKAPWHIEVRRIGGQYVGLLTATDTGNGFGGLILAMASTDGTTWVSGGASCIPTTLASEYNMLYRATFVPEFNDGILGLRVWYSALMDASPDVWNIYRTWVGITSPAIHVERGDAALSVPAISGSTGGGQNIVVTYLQPFSALPFVSVISDSARLHYAVIASSTTGCTIRVENYTAASASGTLQWMAQES